MADRRRLVVGALALVAFAVPVAIALTDRHLTSAPAALVFSTAAASLAVPALALQPLLAGGHRIAWHRALGAAAFVLVLAHVGGLFLVEVDDTLFALSPDGPTRARMALLGTIALLVVVGLGVGRNRLPLADETWRILHGFMAMLVIALGFGHAILTDGALDGAGTVALYALGVLGLVAVPAAFITRTRRARGAGTGR